MKNQTLTMLLTSILITAVVVAASATISYSAELYTLDTALSTAMENSPDIKQTELSLERSRETLKARQAALKSQFSLQINPFSFNRDRTFSEFFSTWNSTDTKASGGTFRVNQPLEWTDGTIALTNNFRWQNSYSEYTDVRKKTYNNNLYIAYEQPLFTYNQIKLDTRELELNLENTLYTYTIQKMALEQSVTQAFFDVFQRKMDLDITADERVNQQQSYDIIKNKVDAGLSAMEELYQAELNLASSELAVQNQQESLDNALDSFKVLIGIPISFDIMVDASVVFEPVDINLDTALNSGLKNRLELRQRDINIERALQNLTRTAAQNEFKGSLTLSYGITGEDEQFGNVFETPTKKQAVGISFDIPLWDWGEKKSRMRASELSIEQEHISLEDLRNNIILAIRRAHRNLLKFNNQIDIAEQNVRNAGLTYDINLERYRNGDLTSMDLNLYQAQLSARKSSLVQTQISYKLALLNMKILSLWDFEKNMQVLPDNIFNENK